MESTTETLEQPATIETLPSGEILEQPITESPAETPAVAVAEAIAPPAEIAAPGEPAIAVDPGGVAPEATAEAVIPAIDPEKERRLNVMFDLGNDICELERRKAEEETIVAECESELKSSRAVLHATEHEIKELHEELTTLATGKQSERLPFKDGTRAKNKSAEMKKLAKKRGQRARRHNVNDDPAGTR